MGNKYKILKRILNNLESSTLPTAEPSDSGKFAKVDENGEYVLGTGGGSSSEKLIIGETTTIETVDEQEIATYTLDKTWKEIYDAFMSTGAVIMKIDYEEFFAVGIIGVSSIGSLHSVLGYDGVQYNATSENGYPSYTDGGEE